MTDVEKYIDNFDSEPKIRLEQVCTICRLLLPGAAEVIRYGIPTFNVGGKNIVHFAGYKNHLGFYPGAAGMRQFSDQLSEYKTGPGSIQFPHKSPLPEELIRQIILFRLKETGISYK